MPTRTIQYFFLFAMLAILAACSPFQTSLERFKQEVASLGAAYPAASHEYLTQEIPPCTPVEGSTVDPCEPSVRITAGIGGGMSSSSAPVDSPSTVRQYLNGSSLISISHIVLRGTYIPDTVRCTRDNPFHIPSYEEPDYFQNSILMHCYADVRANAYVLGSGPPRLTVLVHFLHYWENYFATPDRTHDEQVDLGLWATEIGLEEGDAGLSDDPTAGIYGREILLFLGPSHNHATEVWQVFGTWDVQRQDDGTVIAVHPARDYWMRTRPDEYQTHRAALEMELPAFTQAVADAQTARIAENNGRIAPADISSKAEGVDLPMLITDANRLSQFYTDTGAYNHPDGPPTQPSPVAACAPGNAVENTAANRPLIRDCSALLDARNALAGTATLNWTASLAIGSWTGVGGTPQRATGVNLSSSSLNGTIPDGLGDLSALTTLDLSSNQLTGAIPASLGELSDLSTLRLSGNSFSGCIPPALRDVTTNDLATVGLSYCDMLTPPSPSGVNLALTNGVFTINWDAVSGAEKYEAQHQPGGTVDEWPALPETEELTITHTPGGGLACETIYRFRVRAYGDGIMHSADWATPSDEVTHTTEACNSADMPD